jgi:hypothetical protein
MVRGLLENFLISLLQIFKYTISLVLTGHLDVYNLVYRLFKVTATVMGTFLG